MEVCRFLCLLCATLLLNAIGSNGGRRRGWRLRRQLCPKDYLGELGLCRREIIALTRQGSRDVKKLCRAHLSSLDCMESIFQACSHLPDVQAVADMMDVPNLRISMERQCPREFHRTGVAEALQDGCPGMRQFARNFRTCADQYNANAFHNRMTRRRCRRAAEALECLDQLSSRCGRFAHIRQYSFDWVNLRNKCDYPAEDTAEKELEEGEGWQRGRGKGGQQRPVAPPHRAPPPRQFGGSVPRKSEPCPPGFMEEINLCRALGTAPLPVPPHSATATQCRTYYRELECLEDLVMRCWDQPVIQGQLDQWNPARFRQELDDMCSSNL